MLFDTHAHLQDERFADDLEAVLADMRENGVDRCCVVGSDMPASRDALELAGRYPQQLICAMGVHPHEAKAFTGESMDELCAVMDNPLVKAWGEIGLDFYYDFSPRDVQMQVFVWQLEMAVRLQKPTILHVRDAHSEVLDVLTERKGDLPPYVVHCFSGSWETAKRYLNLNAMISLAGPVTFSNARNLHEVAQHVPLDRLMVETDAPYLSPVPMRGKRNSPANVRFVAEQVARLRGVSVEEVATATYVNGCKFYRWEQ